MFHKLLSNLCVSCLVFMVSIIIDDASRLVMLIIANETSKRVFILLCDASKTLFNKYDISSFSVKEANELWISFGIIMGFV